MNYVYNKGQIKFTIKSNYTCKPVEFSVRRKQPPSSAELKRLELEVAYLEQWAWDQENTVTEAFRCEYAAKARENFKRILHGEIHACCIEIISVKSATRLNERGENDYVAVRTTRTPFRKWVRA